MVFQILFPINSLTYGYNHNYYYDYRRSVNKHTLTIYSSMKRMPPRTCPQEVAASAWESSNLLVHRFHSSRTICRIANYLIATNVIIIIIVSANFKTRSHVPRKLLYSSATVCFGPLASSHPPRVVQVINNITKL